MFSSGRVLSAYRPQDWDKMGVDIDGTLDLESQGSLVALSDDGRTLATLSGSAAGYTISESLSRLKIYSWNGSTWTQKGTTIQSSYGLGNPKMGSMHMSGNGSRVAVSDYNVDPTESLGLGWGHVRIYGWSGSSWTAVGTPIVYQNEENLYMSSVSMNLTGDTVAIAAPEMDVPNQNGGYYLRAGMVRVYKWNGSSWLQRGQNISTNSINSATGGGGVSLSDDGNTLAVGTIANGIVSVYGWNGSSWVKKGADIQGKVAGDLFGGGVCLSSDGNTVCGGSPPAPGSEDGYTSVYSWNGSSWSQKGPDIVWGLTSLSMSKSGGVVAMGSSFMNGNGRARVYSWTGSSWRLMGKEFRGDFQSRNGQSISISGNGSVVAVGNPGVSSLYNYACGRTYVYEWLQEKPSVLFVRW